MTSEQLLDHISQLVLDYEADNYPECVGLVIKFTSAQSCFNWNAGFEPASWGEEIKL